MRPTTLLLLSAATTTATAAHCGGSDSSSHDQSAVLVYHHQFAAQAQAEIHLPAQDREQAQAHNRTLDVQRGSTPGTQIMSPWRQLVGGIAVAVLVAVV